jgi:hypothetical protein
MFSSQKDRVDSNRNVGNDDQKYEKHMKKIFIINQLTKKLLNVWRK